VGSAPGFSPIFEFEGRVNGNFDPEDLSIGALDVPHHPANGLEPFAFDSGRLCVEILRRVLASTSHAEDPLVAFPRGAAPDSPRPSALMDRSGVDFDRAKSSDEESEKAKLRRK
jgi:hypothetical protein